jgi:hypothetical protein
MAIADANSQFGSSKSHLKDLEPASEQREFEQKEAEETKRIRIGLFGTVLGHSTGFPFMARDVLRCLRFGATSRSRENRN